MIPRMPLVVKPIIDAIFWGIEGADMTIDVYL
jgi:hypothetical protein